MENNEVVDELAKEGQFRIRVRTSEWEVEVSAPDRDFVLNESDRLISQFSSTNPITHSTKEEIIQGEVTYLPRATKPQTLNEFFRQFKLQTHLDKILVFGYWCEVRQGQAHFTSDDIMAKYKEAKEPPPANIRRDISNLLGKGFLLSDGKSEDGTLAYELTNTGIREVESKMPQ
ncbi:MAG TPA: hypothetical protein VNG51_06745 [Ktedonobacteraceae bacterium]|nr:hypothetical protein [Ktedonobacteraceae bacterium]